MLIRNPVHSYVQPHAFFLVLFYFTLKKESDRLKKNIKRIDRVLVIRTHRHTYNQKRSSVSYVSQKIEMYEVSS